MYFYCSLSTAAAWIGDCVWGWIVYCHFPLLTTDYHMYIRLSTKCSCQVCSLCAKKESNLENDNNFSEYICLTRSRPLHCLSRDDMETHMNSVSRASNRVKGRNRTHNHINTSRKDYRSPIEKRKYIAKIPVDSTVIEELVASPGLPTLFDSCKMIDLLH